MPTRSYYFPKDFKHLENILRAEPDGFPDAQVEKYRALGLPPIPTTGSLSLFLGISPKTIFSIRQNAEQHYRSFTLTKKDGSKRNIDTPRTYLKVIQWWILDNILNNAHVAENVFGFVAGRSVLQNAIYHHGAKHVLNVDIRQFFPSISIDQVRDIFCTLGYGHDVANMLSELCCLDGRVPQGAPTSPAIANQVLKGLDKELTQLADRVGHRYSRYADDLTFSSKKWISKELIEEIQTAVAVAGFELKSEKTRFSGTGGRMEVTGIVINETLQPSRNWRKRTRATLHKLSLNPRLTRREISYLNGIRGMAAQFPESLQMCKLSEQAATIQKSKSSTVIGYGNHPILPKSLTIRQAQALAALQPRNSNTEIAIQLGTTEAAVKKRLQEAFRKIDVSNRLAAFAWAKRNL
jgi:RNA-directed DNA polymerase